MVNGMKAPQKRHFMQSQMNEIFSDVRNHNGHKELQQPGHSRDKVLENRNPQILDSLGSGQ